MIEVKHLKTLQALRNCGSLAAAAATLHQTQSALSHQFSDLEQPAASVYTAGRNPVATGESGAAANQPGTASLQ